MRVGVVGAGITGLSVTHHLARHDVDVVAFDADREPGGVVRSTRVDGRVLEYGPQRIRLTPGVAELVEDVDLGDRLLEADDDLPLYVYARGKLRVVPRSLSAFLRTDLLSWRGKLRLFAEPLTDPASEGERAARIFQRKFGYEAYRNVVEPLFGGIYGSDPTVMPAKYSLSRLIALEERKGSLLRPAAERVLGNSETPAPVSFEDGLQALPEALYRTHEPYVHLNTPVDAVRDADDGGYVLEAGGRDVPVDRVVVTVPAAAAASILDGVAEATVAPLRRLAYNSLAVVYLRADVDAEGFGYQVRRDESLETLGVSWNDSLFDRDGVYTVYLGGMHDPGVVDRPEEELAAVAREEFREVMGAEATALDVVKLPRAFPAHDVTWKYLDDVELPDGITLATNYTARIGVPSRIREAKSVAETLSGNDR